MALRSEDLKMGDENENIVREQLNDYFKTKFYKGTKYGVLDFYNKDRSINVELKSRRIKHNQYPTAIVGYNKILEMKKSKCDNYIAFKYLDGLYIIKYDESIFNTFEIQKDYQRGFRADVGKMEIQIVIHIPYEKLTKIF